jgi:pimeloyl-ACP methyl ester carboxylesterase
MQYSAKRRRFIGSSAAFSLAFIAPAFAHGSGQVSGSIRLDASSSAVDVRVTFPLNPPPWPVVIYSHGLGGSLVSGDFWVDAFVRLGFMVVQPLHLPTSDALFDKSDASRTGRLVKSSLSQDQVPDRVRAIKSLIDNYLTSANGPWSHLVERESIVIAGHSYGALTAMALAGRRGLEFAHHKSIAACILFSPGVGSIPLASSASAIKVPTLCLTGRYDDYVHIGYGTDRVRAGVPLANRLAFFENLPKENRRLVFLNEADHMTFAGERAVSNAFSRIDSAAKLENSNHAVVSAVCSEFLRDFVDKFRKNPMVLREKTVQEWGYTTS